MMLMLVAVLVMVVVAAAVVVVVLVVVLVVAAAVIVVASVVEGIVGEVEGRHAVEVGVERGGEGQSGGGPEGAGHRPWP